ncbi:glutathione peroxidase [Sphingobium algorifonticola]|uniref:Glutathione peroxidase n=1 Tax=Sphingobium algorifonticola TaxID=2008318 RepID=A0A437J6I9_9SPHN|nr:glutathione peroxidase [Sphingobium algorifonticola]RVT40759.1 glutathione peroxidase [Sphingobium algorifonticola]
MTAITDFTVRKPDGTMQSMADYAGRVLLIVNTASQCGFTPQYEGLEALHREYAERGLSVLGFPCNQFGAQEPGDAAEIARFCSLHFDVTFPLFAKIDVNGATADPLFVWLKAQQPGLLGTQAIKWNFTKFLVDRSGHVVARHAPTVKPESLRAQIDALL